jgi:hypothetical protein
LPGAAFGSALAGMATGAGGALGVIPPAVAPGIARALRDIHGPVAGVGLGLLVLAAVGKFWTSLGRRHRAERQKRSIIDKLA